MAKATPAVPCSADNCGDLFPKCGLAVTYKAYGCRCEECRRARREDSQRARDKNPEREADRQRKYVAENREAVAERKRKYNRENQEAIKEYRRQDYLKNREANLERARRYRAENRELVLENLRQWKQENKEHCADYQRRYLEQNREAVKARRLDYRSRRPEVIRAIRQRRRAMELAAFIEDVNPYVVFERDGYICQRCEVTCQVDSYPSLDYATLDHIIPLSWGVFRGGFHSYANTQTLCYSCNSAKGNRE